MQCGLRGIAQERRTQMSLPEMSSPRLGLRFPQQPIESHDGLLANVPALFQPLDLGGLRCVLSAESEEFFGIGGVVHSNVD